MPGQYQGSALCIRHGLNVCGKAVGEWLDLAQTGLVHALVTPRIDRQRQVQARLVELAPLMKGATAGPGKRAQQHMRLALIGA
ncbi:hypothetical protein ALP75_203955 [Pseudomonas syringae pv. actinidiae]|nr:hypothetical protein ALP75_203955 [Pseudomonas syringae pv. actinidiae]